MTMRRKRNRRRQSTNLAGFVVCLVFFLALIVFLDTNVFVIKRITVTGNKTVSNDDVIEISGLAYGQRIFSLDFDAVKDRFARKGDMELIAVTRDWPDGVRIEVAQRNIAAVVEYLGTAVLIGEDCRVIRLASDIPTLNVPVITGLSVVSTSVGDTLGIAKQTQSQDISRLLRGLSEWGLLENISEISLSDYDNVYLVTRGGMIVTLGDMTLTDDKLMWTKNVMDELAGQGISSGKLDVTSGRMAVYSEK